MSGPDAGLAWLGERHALPAGALARLGAFARLLSDDPYAPTSVRDPRRVAEEHLADSLSALALVAVAEARAIVDVGSGAGLPGLPLAIALPAAHVTLLEANGRKCEFIARAATAADAGNADVVHDRAETWSAGRGRHDLVTARALARLDVVAEYAAPLLGLGGSLVAWRGRRDPGDEAAARAACARLGLEPREIVAVTPFTGAEHRHLHVLVKVAEAPPAFPRRPGVARKRPLGASVLPSDRDRR